MSDRFLSEEELDLLRRDRCRELSDDQFAEYRHALDRFRLNPFANQIYSILRFDKRSGKKKLAIQTGIDGFRLIADRTGQYAGSDDAKFDREDPKPGKATVTVYKMVDGQRCAFSASARWAEYYPAQQPGLWNTKPCVMLAKCAESLALRKAFPAELSGLYTHEEMQQADNTIATPAPRTNGTQKPPATPASQEQLIAAGVAFISATESFNDLVKFSANIDAKVTDELKRGELQNQINARMHDAILQKEIAKADMERLEEIQSWLNGRIIDSERARDIIEWTAARTEQLATPAT